MKNIKVLLVLIELSFLSLSKAQTTIISSNGSSCSPVDSSGITTFTLRALAPQLGSEIDYILVVYDTVRKLPFSTTAFHDSLNGIKAVNRTAEPFTPLPCSQLPLTTAQQNCTGGYSMTDGQKLSSGRFTWDRGHLTPVNPMRFSEDAVNKTFFCVNIAPQDSYTNQNPWKDVEVKSETKIRNYAGGFVQTGVCSSDNVVNGPLTYRGWRIPSCFWKLICYKDLVGVTQVVGFIGNNNLVHINDTIGQSIRYNETIVPKSQSQILSLLTTPSLVSTAWKNAEAILLKNRTADKTKVPTGAQCTAATTATQIVRDEWFKWMIN